jgi:hypothetical protein
VVNALTASPTMAPHKVISSLLFRFETMSCTLVFMIPEFESKVRNNETQKKSEIIQIENGNRSTEDIRIFENMTKVFLTFSNMDVRNVPRYDQIIEDVALQQRTLSACLTFIGQ